MTGAQRSRIIDAARGLLGTPYDDAHDAAAWKDLSTAPYALDCSTFVCRVAAEAGVYRPGLLAPDAEWLLEHLVATPSPVIGDIVGYGRPPLPDTDESLRDVVWHVMIYAGNGQVIGACDIAREVTVRPVEYESTLGARQWRAIESPSFRALVVIF